MYRLLESLLVVLLQLRASSLGRIFGPNTEVSRSSTFTFSFCESLGGLQDTKEIDSSP